MSRGGAAIAWPPSVFASLARCVFRGAVVVVVVVVVVIIIVVVNRSSGLCLFLTRCVAVATVINSVANPSPREQPSNVHFCARARACVCVCVLRYEFVHSSRTHPDARRFSLRVCLSLSLSFSLSVYLSLVCAREKPRERRVCQSAFRGACFLVDVGIARSSVASVAPGSSSRAKLIPERAFFGAGIVPRRARCARIGLSRFATWLSACVRA